jgi:hypothetical protein
MFKIVVVILNIYCSLRSEYYFTFSEFSQERYMLCVEMKLRTLKQET